MRWRLIVDAPADGARNMAVDEALAGAVDAGSSPPTLRLYRWVPACLSLGFSQPHTVANEAFCRAHGIDLVRRPTGGRAVLHHLELTYSVAAPLAEPPFTSDLQASYRLICRAVVAGLRAAGVPAELAGEPAGGLIRPTQAIPCFIGPAAGEVTARGRKLVGSAMRRVGGAILQHGSILEGWDGALQAGCLGLANDDELRAAVITLADLLGAAPEPHALAAALVDGFVTVIGCELDASALAPAELEQADRLARKRYGHRRWTVGRSSQLGED